LWFFNVSPAFTTMQLPFLHFDAVPQTPCAKVFDFCTTFFHPDFTVGPGVSPDPALFALVDYHHRSGIAKRFIFWLTLPRRF
jgi:hypothetical protein